jgi:hypothetical protein
VGTHLPPVLDKGPEASEIFNKEVVKMSAEAQRLGHKMQGLPHIQFLSHTRELHGDEQRSPSPTVPARPNPIPNRPRNTSSPSPSIPAKVHPHPRPSPLLMVPIPVPIPMPPLQHINKLHQNIQNMSRNSLQSTQKVVQNNNK